MKVHVVHGWNSVTGGAKPAYGPNDTTVTKIVAGVFRHTSAEAIIERGVGAGITENVKV